MTYVLGVSAFFHDSAAAVVADGRILAAVQEERFTREKYDSRFPVRAINYCLSAASIGPEQVDYVAYYEQPLTKLERLLETYFAFAPRGFRSYRRALPVWLQQKLHVSREIRRSLRSRFRGRVVYPSHHESHAASAFFPSPFEEAAVLTLDGVGEWSTTTVGHGRGNRITLVEEIRFPHSLGLLYSAFTYYCGFSVNSGEYKLMGLAPYGTPAYAGTILANLIDLKHDGSYRMDQSYFQYCQGLVMTSPRFHALFGGAPRQPESPLEQRHMDLAASVQKVCEEVVLRSGRHAWEIAGRPRNLVMAGGVALNCVANGRLLREGPFENVWIQPAAGDAGAALGAALFAWYHLLDKPRQDVGAGLQGTSWLGPAYSDTEVRAALDALGARYHALENGGTLAAAADAIADGKIVGWFQDRAEYGPRALGARSILGDPRNPRTQSDLNLKIKFRESFRPFAPAVLREHAHEWFDVRPNEDAPYMLLVAPVKEARRVPLTPEQQTTLQEDPDLARRVNVVRSSIPAVTHVDYSARVQTVDARHGRFYSLMRHFYERTGCPVLVNTSFNLSWEPIVLTPKEAYQTFMQSAMDALVIEGYLLWKHEQPLGMPLLSRGQPAEVAAPDNPWADPHTGAPLAVRGEALVDPTTGRCYPVEEGIPRLFVLDSKECDGRDVTEIVKSFYETTPFPNYDDLDNVRALIDKAHKGLFARLLNEQIPYGSRVVEVGCGTGQLTNFLAIGHRAVIGIDACLNSLRLAEEFKRKNSLERATFAQMNLFHPALRDGYFDYVISNGVLHHTRDCRGAFRRISRLARPGGYLVVGLYNWYSRTLHYARRALYRMTGITGRWLDPHFGRVKAGEKREAWFQDQYCHPHETSHSLDEVLGWLDEAGLEFVNSIPKPVFGMVPLAPDERLFEPRPRGSALDRFLSQVADLGSGYREGGFFTIIVRRK